MEKKIANEMEAGSILGCIYIYKGYIGIMENKMETLNPKPHII